jgi:hypothetical protein
MRSVALAALFATSFVVFSFGGETYVIELVLLLGLLLAAASGRLAAHPTKLGLWVTLLAVWALSQFATDVVRLTSPLDMTKGFLRVLFLATNLLAIARLTRGASDRLLAVSGGLALSGILGFVLLPNAYTAGEPWKFGLAYPLTLGAFTLTCLARSPVLKGIAVVAVPVLALVDLLQGARSLFGITLAAAALCIYHRFYRSKHKPRRAAFVVVALVVGTLASSSAYAHLASSGALGPKQALKYASQSHGRYGAVLGGRPEFAYSFIVLSENPVLGVGSYAQLTTSLDLQARTLLTSWGYRRGAQRADLSDRVPTHSGLLGSWVEGGLGAAFFWLALAALCLRILALGPRSARLAPLQIYLATGLVWDVMFSPYGADRRLTVAVSLLVLLCRDPARRPEALDPSPVTPTQPAASLVRVP